MYQNNVAKIKYFNYWIHVMINNFYNSTFNKYSN